MSILTNRRRQFTIFLEIGEIATELKKKAKNIPGSFGLQIIAITKDRFF